MPSAHRCRYAEFALQYEENGVECWTPAKATKVGKVGLSYSGGLLTWYHIARHEIQWFVVAGVSPNHSTPPSIVCGLCVAISRSGAYDCD
jgi:hypothetical protein